MIVTLTANPSLDRTVALSGPLDRGRVQRATAVTSEPGGKGVNVARVVTDAGALAVAVLPGQHDDPLLMALRERGVPHRPVPAPGPARVNLTLAEPDGTTTKVNEPGLPLDQRVLDELTTALVREAAGARWAVLSGSLPPGVPVTWYAELVAQLRRTGAGIAVDTSGAPLLAALDPHLEHLPDLVKPNGEELAEIVGTDADLEEDVPAAAEAAQALVRRGVGTVLVTLGARGALVATAEGVWTAPAPRIQARSTVGAGDSALAGYLLADLAGAPVPHRLRRAVAYGAAAASLPGSTLPRPGDVDESPIAPDRLPPGPARPASPRTAPPTAPQLS